MKITKGRMIRWKVNWQQQSLLQMQMQTQMHKMIIQYEAKHQCKDLKQTCLLPHQDYLILKLLVRKRQNPHNRYTRY